MNFTAMNKFESLIRVILWLSKRDWGLSLLLAFVSFVAVVAMPGQSANHLFEGPIFSAGVYVGAIFFPGYATRGTNGFYLVPLFGAAADFMVLLAFWFAVVWTARRLRGKRQDGHLQQL
jgi:hypothetical protein